MRSRQTLIKTILSLFLGLSLIAAGGCATDRQVVSQAAEAHGQLEPAVIHNPELSQYIQSVGDRIITAARQLTSEGYQQAGSSEEDRAWMFSNRMQFHLVDSEELNAFTTGGEHMYIHTALFEQAKSEDELAAVMAHEFAHVYGRHVQSAMNRQYATLGAAAAAGAAGYALGEGDDRLGTAGTYAGAAGLLGQLVGMGYSRDDERQADAMGFDFYVRAGWDPAKFNDFFKLLIEKGNDSTLELISTHPSLGSRVEAIDTMVAKLPPSARQYRKPPIADQARFLQLQQLAKQAAAAKPKTQATQQAKKLLASFPSCVEADVMEQEGAKQPAPSRAPAPANAVIGRPASP